MSDPIVHLASDQTDVGLHPGQRLEALQAAIWVTCSPHEHTWSLDEQALMARYCLWAHQRLAAVGQLANGPLERGPRS